MHLSVTFVTALAVFFHLGTTLASQVLRDATDRRKIAALDAKADQIFGAVTALAPVIQALTQPPAPVPAAAPAAVPVPAAGAEN